MKDLDQQIEDAAKDYGQREGMFLSITKAVAFTAGAKSEVSKKFHQQGMFSEEDMLEFAQTCYDDYSDSPFSFRELLAEWIEHKKKR